MPTIQNRHNTKLAEYSTPHTRQFYSIKINPATKRAISCLSEAFAAVTSPDHPTEVSKPTQYASSLSASMLSTARRQECKYGTPFGKTKKLTIMTHAR